MALQNTLNGWLDGPLPARDDGGLAIVEIKPGILIDGQDAHDRPVIVSRWENKLKTTAGSHRLEYEDVVRYIDIAPPYQ